MWTKFDLWSKYVARTNKPILIGPYHSEVGFETLYFLPWLARWRKTYSIDKSRIFVISRGGAAVWYDAHASLDLYDYMPMEAVRQETLKVQQATGSVKQQAIPDWERALVPVLANRLGLEDYHWLHPSMMYNDLKGWWGNEMSLSELYPKLLFQPVPSGPTPVDMPLPQKYLAVQFYARATWPFNEQMVLWVQQQCLKLSQDIPLVLLESDLAPDDHMPFPISGPNILSAKNYVTQTTNLAVYSAIIAKSSAFVGTYGGTMQLAVRMGKPSIGYYSEFGGTAYAHKLLTECLATQAGLSVYIGRPQDADVVRQLTR